MTSPIWDREKIFPTVFLPILIAYQALKNKIHYRKE
jgi:hypothetical protein